MNCCCSLLVLELSVWSLLLMMSILVGDFLVGGRMVVVGKKLLVVACDGFSVMAFSITKCVATNTSSSFERGDTVRYFMLL